MTSVPWIRIDDSFFRHPKARAVGTEGRELYIASICFAHANDTDGLISTADLPIVAAEAQVKTVMVRRLVSAGLWEQVTNGWQIHDYGDHQESAASARRARQKNRERIAAWREKQAANGVGNASGNGVTTSVTEGVRNGSVTLTHTDTKKGLKRSPSSGAEGDFDSWWAEYPRKVDKQAALKAYKARRRGGAEVAALLAAVKHYADAVRDSDPQFVKHAATFLAGSWSEWVDGPPEGVTANGVESHERLGVAPEGEVW